MMLPELGEHASFIWASYGAVFGVLVALGAWLVLEGRRLQRQLGELERRRSDVRQDAANSPRAGGRSEQQ